MARGTPTDATRHARPRGRAARAHVRRRWRTGRGHVAGGHAGPRRCPGGATWQRGWHVKGPRVSGPWLEYWGGNAIALNRPLFNRKILHFFFCVGLCSRGFSFADDMPAPQALDLLARRRLRGLESTRSSIRVCALNPV